MSTSIETLILEEHFLNFFARIGWNTQYQLVVKEGDTQGHILEAYIDLKEWIVSITYPKGFIKRFIDINLQNSLVGKYEPSAMKHSLDKKLISNPKNEKLLTTVLYNFLSGVAYHEFGHSSECPIDNHNFSVILEAASAALERNKKMSEQVLGYVVNIFSDTVLNTIYGLEDKNSFFRNSFLLFHYSELVQFGMVNPDFAFFVLLNLYLYQFHPDIRKTIEGKVIPKLPANYKLTIDKLVKIFCPYPIIATKMKKGTILNESEKWKVINYLSDTDNWAKMSYELADILSQFISPNQIKKHQPIPDSSFTQKFKKDKQFKKEIADRIIDRKMKKTQKKAGGGYGKKTTKRTSKGMGSGSKKTTKKTKKKGAGG